MYQAKIDGNQICISEQEASILLDGYIEIDGFGHLGKRYKDGQWVFVPTLEPQHNYTDTQLIMQALADQELRDLQAQAERQMLAQQITDVELATMGGEYKCLSY